VKMGIEGTPVPRVLSWVQDVQLATASKEIPTQKKERGGSPIAGRRGQGDNVEVKRTPTTAPNTQRSLLIQRAILEITRKKESLRDKGSSTQTNCFHRVRADRPLGVLGGDRGPRKKETKKTEEGKRGKERECGTARKNQRVDARNQRLKT